VGWVEKKRLSVVVKARGSVDLIEADLRALKMMGENINGTTRRRLVIKVIELFIPSKAFLVTL